VIRTALVQVDGLAPCQRRKARRYYFEVDQPTDVARPRLTPRMPPGGQTGLLVQRAEDLHQAAFPQQLRHPGVRTFHVAHQHTRRRC
jgi:hypothetical protein